MRKPTVGDTKRCPKCGETKPIDAFSWRNKAQGIRQTWCKTCSKEYQDARLADPVHQEAARVRAAEWLVANPERAKASQKALYDKRRADPEEWAKALAYQREWYHENIEEQRPKKAAYMRERYARMSPAQKHRVANRTHLRRLGVPTLPFTDEAFVEKWAYWNNRCWICGGIPDSTDHLIPVTKGGWNAISNFRPICHTCNPAKGNRWPFPLDPAKAREAIGVSLVDEADLDGGYESIVVKKRVDGVPTIAWGV